MLFGYRGWKLDGGKGWRRDEHCFEERKMLKVARELMQGTFP
jgi:hypothetical protein